MASITVSSEALSRLKTLLAQEDKKSCIRLRTYNIGSG